MPLIRYRTRDITHIIPEKCGCGRTHRRIEPVRSRLDDILIINGVNIYPSQIEECIYSILSHAANYLIRIQKHNELKKMYIYIEIQNEILHDLSKLREVEKSLVCKIRARTTYTPIINFIPQNSLPNLDGKAKRVLKENY